MSQKITFKTIIWVLFAIDWLLVLIANLLPIQGWPAIIYGIWLVLSMPPLTLILIWLYRQYLQTWRGLLFFIVLFYLGGVFVFGYRSENPVFSFVSTMLTWNVAIGLGLVLALFFWQNDMSFAFLGSLSLLLLWGVLWLGVRHETILRLFLCNNEAATPCLYWPLAPLICLFFWAIPTAFIGFVHHSIKLLEREW